MEQEGNSKPFCAGVSPVALHTALVSIAGLEPSMTMSIGGSATSFSQSWLIGIAASAGSTRFRFSLARSGARSAIRSSRIPGVLGTCARYIAANLPAPIRPMRRGLPCSSRSRSLAYRFNEPVLPGKRHVVVLEQTIVRQALDRSEIPVRNVVRPLEAADVV